MTHVRSWQKTLVLKLRQGTSHWHSEHIKTKQKKRKEEESCDKTNLPAHNRRKERKRKAVIRPTYQHITEEKKGRGKL